MSDHKYTMKMNLNVLNHLGIKLYSNVPAVLSEAVANAWDADAEKVEIVINKQKNEITITDDGHGMSESDVNDKYLTVGYQRRKKEGDLTPKHKRRVMGRKGIGKLSLFSVANIIEVQSIKGGEKNGFILDAYKISRMIDGEDGTTAVYYPDALPENEITLNREGTRIVLRDLKKNLGHTTDALKKRIARRFSIIGKKYKFTVFLNGNEVSVADRNYFKKIQYMWYFGEESKEYVSLCDPEKFEFDEMRDDTIGISRGEKELPEIYRISGWIGTVATSGDLKDGKENLNKIVIMVRGKLAQEDILEDFPEGGLYSKYLIGEIHADFLDLTEQEDIATSNRQEIIKDDPRYEALQAKILSEVKYIGNRWTDYRNETGLAKALELKQIDEWYHSLLPKYRAEAKKLFGKINTLKFEKEADRRLLLKHAVLAFESFKHRQNLEAIDKISPENLQALGEMFSYSDDLEATLYYQIVDQRVAVINALLEKTTKDAREKMIQEHIFDHLWLLDPSWERATETPYMERSVASEFERIDAKLTEEEKRGRVDIKYKAPSGKHVIIELKRASVRINSHDLSKQAAKYYRTMKKLLQAADKLHEPVEVVCILGQRPSDWEDEEAEEHSRRSLWEYHTRIVFYDQLIEDAYRSYRDYLEVKRSIGKLQALLQTLDEEEPSTIESPAEEPSMSIQEADGEKPLMPIPDTD